MTNVMKIKINYKLVFNQTYVLKYISSISNITKKQKKNNNDWNSFTALKNKKKNCCRKETCNLNARHESKGVENIKNKIKIINFNH